MKKQKSFHLGLLALCLLACLFFALPVKAQAATFKECSRDTKTGKYYIWSDQNDNAIRISTSKSGIGKLLVKAASGRYMSHGCISDGTTVYYVERGAIDKNGNHKGYICKIKVNGTGKSRVGTLKNACCPKAYYKGSLYLDCYDTSDPTVVHTYRMTVKSGKTKRAMKNASVMEQSGQYLLARPNSGAICPLSLYIYNCKSGKAVCITKKGSIANFVGKKVYYAEYVKGGGGPDSILRIRSCSLTGKSKKTIVAKIKTYAAERITAKYVYYRTMSANSYNWRYYRYDIKKKKAAKMSQSKYEAQVWR